MLYNVLMEITDDAQGDAQFNTNLTDALTRAAVLVNGVTSVTVQQVGPELTLPVEP